MVLSAKSYIITVVCCLGTSKISSTPKNVALQQHVLRRKAIWRETSLLADIVERFSVTVCWYDSHLSTSRASLCTWLFSSDLFALFHNHVLPLVALTVQYWLNRSVSLTANRISSWFLLVSLHGRYRGVSGCSYLKSSKVLYVLEQMYSESSVAQYFWIELPRCWY